MASSKDSRRSNSEDNDNLIANRYKIMKKLGKNSNGSTYLVTDIKTDDIKCIKTKPMTPYSRTEIKEILREESILSTLDCPYILRYYESFLFNESICVVTEYCDGGDLAYQIKNFKNKDEKLSEEKLLFWFAQIVAACHYLHSRKILHRNIKPANILVKNGNIKLGDFGISRQLKGEEDASTFIGTPYYMSPEVVKNERYNSKSDIWSIGCVLYELATFQRPFLGDSVFDIFNSIMKDEAPSLVHLYSQDLNRLLKKTLSKVASDRPSAGDLLTEPILADTVKLIMQRAIDNAKSADKMASLIYSLAALGEVIDDDAFGEYDDRSTLRPTPKGSLRSTT